MAPSIKEGVEAAGSAQESSVQQSITQAKPASGSLRSDAVSLEVPIKIHGSRAVSPEVASTTEPFEEETTTIIVFPQGGVLRMATRATVGQMLVLTNLKSRQDAICRVAKVRSFSNTQSYVEVEFTQPQTKYWGVYFTSEGGAARRQPSTTVQRPSAKPAPAPENLNPSISAQKPPAPKPIRGVYSKEVNPVGSPSGLEASLSKPVASEKPTYARELHKSDVTLALATAPAADAASSSLKDLAPAVEPLAGSVAHDPLSKHTTLESQATAHTDDIPGALGNETFAGDSAASLPESFGASLDAGLAQSASSAAQPRQNRILIGACIVVLFGAVAGGVWYFRSKAAANDAQDESSSVSTASQSTASSPVQGPGAPEPLPATPASGSALAREQTYFNSASTAATTSGSASGPAKNDNWAPAQPDAVAMETKPVHAPRNMFASKMKAHPLSSARSLDSQNQEPVLDAGAVPAPEPAGLPGMDSSEISVPPPPGFEGAVAAGRVTEPKLISSVLPVYPSVARQARVEGDVVVDTQIDKNGNVAHMNVISGPSMLRQAALDALRRWKYQPQQLDGKSVEGEILVKIKFRL